MVTLGATREQKLLRATAMKLRCSRCGVVWESDFKNDFCCSAYRRGQGHTDRCWQQSIPDRAVDNTASEDKARFVPILVDILAKAQALKPPGK